MEVRSFFEIVRKFDEMCFNAKCHYEPEPLGILVDYINIQGVRNKFVIRNIWDYPNSYWKIYADCVSDYRMQQNDDMYGIDGPDFAITNTLTLNIDNIQSATIVQR